MIKLIKSTFYHEEETKKKLCDFIMASKQLSMGEKCAKFEREFSKYQGRKYSVLFNSGSSANLALIQALLNLGILKESDKVGFSAVTWSTNVMPLLQLNFNPVPIDISVRNLNVCSDNLLEVLKNSDLKALFITNLLGFAGDLDKIKKICDEKRIILLEDNCESLGSEINGKKLGNFGMASTFSFFVGHHMSTIEGGMVCTDDEDLYFMLSMVRAHGWDRNLPKEKQTELRNKFKVDDFHSAYTFYCPGYNLRPTEITGFLGLEQLKYIKEIISIREKNFKRFDEVAKSNPDFEHYDLNHMDTISNFAYPLIGKGEPLERYKNLFKENHIEIRPIVGGFIVDQPFFKEYMSKNKLKFSCPVAKEIGELGFYFPNNPELTKEEIQIICRQLENNHRKA